MRVLLPHHSRRCRNETGVCSLTLEAPCEWDGAYLSEMPDLEVHYVAVVVGANLTTGRLAHWAAAGAGAVAAMAPGCPGAATRNRTRRAAVNGTSPGVPAAPMH